MWSSKRRNATLILMEGHIMIQRIDDIVFLDMWPHWQMNKEESWCLA